MQIVIEGCDGVGKTTIAKYLVTKFKLGYLHFTGEDKKSKTFYNAMLYKKNFVYDRGAISELVYPNIYERFSRLDMTDVRSIVSKHSNVFFIVLYGNEQSIVKNLSSEESKTIKDNIDYINSKFKTIFYELRNNKNVIGINIDEFKNINELRKFVVEKVRGFYGSN